MTRKRAGQVVGFLLIVATTAYLASAIVTNWEAVRRFEWQVRPGLLAASVALHVAVLAWGVWVWSRVIVHFGTARMSVPVLLRIWFFSNLARYIPGKIFQFLAVVQLGRGAAVPADVLLGSLLLHSGFALLGAVLVSGWTVAGELLPAVPPLALGVVLTALAAGFVHPYLLNTGLELGSRLLRRPLLSWHGSWLGGLSLLLLSVVTWIFYGLAYTLLIASLAPIPLTQLPLLTGVNALSFVAGYLALFAPGGLGVREAAMTRLLLPVLPHGTAALLAIAARLWTIAAELIGGFLVLSFGRHQSPPVGEPRDSFSGVQ